MVYVFGTVEILKCLSIGGGGLGGGGGGGGVYETRNCLLSPWCMCVGYSCFKTSLVIPLLFATVPYNRHAQ